MEINHSQFSSSARPAISKWLSATLVIILFAQSVVWGRSRRAPFASAPVASMMAAPQAGSIEVNTTVDGDNLNPSAGCDSDAAAPGDPGRDSNDAPHPDMQKNSPGYRNTL